MRLSEILHLNKILLKFLSNFWKIIIESFVEFSVEFSENYTGKKSIISAPSSKVSQIL